MLVRSIKTKLEHEITAEGWEKMKARGDGPKYVILSRSTKRNTMPEEVRKARAPKPKKVAVAPPEEAETEKKDLLE